ncbi:MAG TPA: PAS domain S-box protein [Planctomycetota bacterium]
MSGEIYLHGRERREGDRLRRDPALLSAVLDGAGAPTLVLDARGRIVLFNRACETLSGYRADEIRGRFLWDVLVPEAEAPAWKAAFDPIRPERVRARQELSWRTKEGQIRRVAWWDTVLSDADGVPTYVVSTGVDLTELRTLETRAAEIAEKERERVGQDLHDGLGQDLTGVALSCGLLKSKLAAVSPALAAEAGAIETLARKAIGKARSLTRGVYPAGLVAGALPDYLKDMAKFVEETFGVRVELTWDDGLSLRDEASARNLYWIVQEAVTNAVKHGRSRRIRIEGKRESKRAWVTVRDDGKGLGPAVKADGMGLRVMKSRARAIGGELRVADQPGGGVLVECVILDSA